MPRKSKPKQVKAAAPWTFTDDEVINWMRRHDLSASVMEARAMMDDAASLHLVRVVPAHTTPPPLTRKPTP